MATLQQVVQLVFEGIDNTTETTGTVIKGIGAVATAGQTLTQPLADATSAVLGFERKLLETGASMVLFAANEAQKFELAFREIATLIKQPVENLGDFRRDILLYAQSSTQSIDQILQATYDAISGGVDYEDALDRVRVAEVLAISSKASLGDSVKAIGRIVTAFAGENITAADAADALFTIVVDGVTTMPQLVQSIGQVVGPAGAAGLKLGEMGAAIATLTLTMEPSEAVIALKNVINGIVSPTDQAKEAARKLGIEFSGTNLAAAGFTGIMRQVATASGGNVDILTQLFTGQKAYAGAVGLTNNDMAIYLGKLDAQIERQGAAERAMAKFKGAIDTGKDALIALAVQLGEPVLNAFVSAKGEITNITNTLANALLPGGALAGLSGVLGDIGADIEATLRAVAKNLPAALNNVDFSGFLDSLRSLWAAIVRLLRLEELQTETGLTAAIQAVIKLLTQTTKFTVGVLNSLEGLVEPTKEFIKELGKLDPATILAIGELGGYALAANVGFTALAGGAAVLYGAIKVVPPLLLATKVELAALGAFAAGASGAALLAFMGRAGIAGAAALVAYELGRDDGVIDKLKDFAGLDQEQGLFTGGITKGTNAIWNALLRLTGYLDEDGKPTMDQYAASAEGAGNALTVAGGDAAAAAVELGKLENITLPTFEYADELAGLATDAESAGQALANLPGDIQKTEGAFIEAGQSTDEYAASLGGVSTQYKQIGEGTVKATGAFAEVKGKTKDAAQALDELTNSGKLSVDELLKITGAANDFKLKMEEIASNERIKTIEAKITLDVARLEAETQQVEAAFESITATIEDTGKVLGDLYDLWGDADSLWDKAKVEGWIRDENKRRDAAMEMQNNLIQTQIDAIKARTDAMNRGDAFITVNGDGLAPHLEAFMWEVLKAIQVQASADMQEFLLGVAAA
jgi:TP901 family phage tail tape measure protein